VSTIETTGQREVPLGRERHRAFSDRIRSVGWLLPGYAAVALMLIWAEHDGGYDQDTWYWGALGVLLLVVVCSVRLAPQRRLSRPLRWAFGLFGAYVVWSYISISWAGSPGDALDGSNRTLLYLLVFALFAILPWTAGTALAALLIYTIGIGALGVDVLYRLAEQRNLPALLVEGRLSALTGYFNATAALFTSGALLATLLATRRELPGLLRGLLLGLAAACLQLAVAGQSRGWLFTLPFVAALTLLVVRNRFRFAAAMLIPVAATLIPIHRLLDIYTASNHSLSALDQACARAGHLGLFACAGAAIVGVGFAWADDALPDQLLRRNGRRALGIGLIVLAVGGACLGASVATHGHPVRFVQHQWDGFSHTEQATHGQSNFEAVGSGRYDFWRVALDAFVAHPLGGLGQDNFADYYILHRHTSENPAWPHSLELRLLASTGIVGFLLFVGFLIAALWAAARAFRNYGRGRHGGRLGRTVAAAALIPLIDWTLHGSVDWFWEIPALTAPALGFLGMAASLSNRTSVRVAGAGPGPDATVAPSPNPSRPRHRSRPRPRVSLPRPRVSLPRPRVVVGGALAAVAVVAATAVLGLTYLAVREYSTASNLQRSDPSQALHDVRLAAKFDPLWAQPGRLGGTIALDSGREAAARTLFRQATAREPGGWYAWFGLGLAQSALGNIRRARADLQVAARIDRHQPTIDDVLAHVAGPTPVPPLEALYSLEITQ
jgi:hypothetical protein